MGARETVPDENQERGWLADPDAVEFRALLESTPAYFYVVDVETLTALYRSPQAERMLGYTEADWESNPLLGTQIVHPDDSERRARAFAATAQTGVPFQEEYRVINKEGDIRWLRDHAALVVDKRGRKVIQGVVLDFTDEVAARKRTEDQLALNLSLLESAQQVGRVGTFIAWLTPEMEGKDVWSKSCLAIFGLTEEQHGGRNETFWEHVHPDDIEMVRAAQNRAMVEGEFYDMVHRIIRQDGQVRWIRERGCDRR